MCLNDRKKKVRGQKRKLKKLINNIDQIDQSRAFSDRSRQMNHIHVPGTSWIEMPGTNGKVKTEFCKAWIRKAEELIAQKPKDVGFCKVVANIDYPDLWSSQIVIFFDEVYYKTFWDRKGPYQRWDRMDEGKSFVADRGITTELVETGYIETLYEESDCYRSTLWFYSD